MRWETGGGVDFGKGGAATEGVGERGRGAAHAPVAGADLRAALVASCLRGALPPVDLRAVCFVRAMIILSLSEFCVCTCSICSTCTTLQL